MTASVPGSGYIELPFRTRSGDRDPASGPSAPIPEPGPRLPFLVGLLLSARAPWGLDVETKSDGRVVGTWAIEINPRGADGTYVSQAKADLHVCASTVGDPRSTGAFLVIRQWWVNVADAGQVAQLYEGVARAALERLDSLATDAPAVAAGESRQCVLYLLDGRRLERKLLSLSRLQSQLLQDQARERAVAGIELRIAFGRGRGTAAASSLPAESAPSPSVAAIPHVAAADAVGIVRSAREVGEVFIREAVSEKNARWNRRASDKVTAMLSDSRYPAPEAAPTDEVPHVATVPTPL